METLKTLRERKRVSQQYLADRLGVSQPYISQFESGIASMSEDQAVKAARALGVSHHRVITAQKRVAAVREVVKSIEDLDVKALLSEQIAGKAADHLANAVDGLVKVADDDSISDEVREMARRTSEKMLLAVGVSLEDEPAAKGQPDRDHWGRKIKKGRK